MLTLNFKKENLKNSVLGAWKMFLGFTVFFFCQIKYGNRGLFLLNTFLFFCKDFLKLLLSTSLCISLSLYLSLFLLSDCLSLLPFVSRNVSDTLAF